MKTNFATLSCIFFILGINISFTTLAIPPSTQASNIVITNITSTSATISWTNGDGAKRVVFVENPSGTAAAPSNNTTYTASTDWSAKGTRIGTSNYYCVYNGSGNSVNLTNLTPNANFAVRISEYNGSEGSEEYLTTIVTGNPKTFSTPETPPTTPGTQTSNIVITNITSTSATISWTNGDGAKRVVFVENPSGNAAAPSNNTTYTASTDWSAKGTRIGTSNYYCVYNGSGNSVNLTNLTPNSNFAVRISEYNGSAGSEQYLTTTVTDNPNTFATPAAPVSPPSTQASNIVISSITSTTATISWTNGDGAKRVVFVENPSGTAAAPSNNTTYTASTDWSAKGTRIGTSNYYCVYSGSGNSVSLTNLTPNANFAVRISEYNGSEGNEQYLTTIVTDNPKTFNTIVTDVKQASNVISPVIVSPNPTSGKIQVKSNQKTNGLINISVTNLNGKVIYKASNHKNITDIDLTNFVSGMYVVRTEVDGITTVYKVFKK